ncbi:ABC transporter permease [Dactylosporangium fulvum]|uniref:ABC transporter permease n=1 Tax=Dactylosporangium fulvum TaxID=53359 RepID=A0ABY5W908_9ACTN|nr:ABC transporter permease [Dactylosporangium fulvum]UWP85561.1 ABC transporter permease [Dactylosporangium fulvum]
MSTANPAIAVAGLRHWLVFAARRIGALVAGLAVLMTATFGIVHLIPGDPAREIAGVTASEATVTQLRAKLNLDKPLVTQYFSYVKGVLIGDFGSSFHSQRSVADIIGARLPASLSLALAAFCVVIVVALLVGISFGALTAESRRPRLLMYFGMVTGFLTSIPGFLLGVGLVYLFGVVTQLLPVAGRDGPSSYVLPVIALAIAPAASMARIVRVQTAVILAQDYIRVARSKRLAPVTVQVRHVLPNLATPVLTLGGMLLPALLGGSVVIENVFNWPGLGTEVVSAVLIKDYPVIQGIVLVLGFGVLLTTALVDLALGILDPRSVMAED